MKALLDRIIEARYEADSFYYDKPFRPGRADPPARQICSVWTHFLQ